MQRLQTSKLDAFLLHRSTDLLEPNGKALLDWLKSLRDRGLVDRIGVSIYEASDLDSLPLEHLQLVQLPLSVYDQRLIRDGTVERLQSLGLSIHVRSVLLQGLLVQAPNQWPDHLSQRFLNHHTQWIDYLQQQKLSPLAGALGFVRACKGIEALLFGVVKREELVQILQAWYESETANHRLGLDWAWETKEDLDPRCWLVQ